MCWTKHIFCKRIDCLISANCRSDEKIWSRFAQCWFVKWPRIYLSSSHFKPQQTRTQTLTNTLSFVYGQILWTDEMVLIYHRSRRSQVERKIDVYQCFSLGLDRIGEVPGFLKWPLEKVVLYNMTHLAQQLQHQKVSLPLFFLGSPWSCLSTVPRLMVSRSPT